MLNEVVDGERHDHRALVMVAAIKADLRRFEKEPRQ
jgi:hypothetical protein